MEIFPHRDAYTLFQEVREEENEFLKWKYQKPFVFGLLNTMVKLLKSNIFYPDLKPQNILFNVTNKKTYIVDTDCVFKFEDKNKFDCEKSIEFNPEYCPYFRSKWKSEKIDLFYWMSFSCAKIINYVTKKSDLDETNLQELKKITESMVNDKIQHNIDQLSSAAEKINAIGQNKNWKNESYIETLRNLEEKQLNLLGFSMPLDEQEKFIINLKWIYIENLEYYTFSEDINIDKKLKEIFRKNYPYNVIFILGKAGLGKSTFLQRKFREEINNWEEGEPLPVFILAHGIDIFENFKRLNKLLDTEIDPETSGPFHFFLDSLDEGENFFKDNLIEVFLGPLFKSSTNKILIACRERELYENLYKKILTEKKIGFNDDFLDSIADAEIELTPNLGTYNLYIDISLNNRQNIIQFLNDNLIWVEILGILPLEYDENLKSQITLWPGYEKLGTEIKGISDKINDSKLTPYIDNLIFCKSIFKIEGVIEFLNNFPFSQNSIFYELNHFIFKKDLKEKLEKIDREKKKRIEMFFKCEDCGDEKLIEEFSNLGVKIVHEMLETNKVELNNLNSKLGKENEIFFINTDLYNILNLNVLPLKMKKEDQKNLVISFSHENFRKYFFYHGSRKFRIGKELTFREYWKDIYKSHLLREAFFEFFYAMGLEKYPEGTYKYIKSIEGVKEITVYSKKLNEEKYVREKIILADAWNALIKVGIENNEITISYNEFISFFSKIFPKKLERNKKTKSYFREYNNKNKKIIFSIHFIKEIENDLQEDYLKKKKKEITRIFEMRNIRANYSFELRRRSENLKRHSNTNQF